MYFGILRNRQSCELIIDTLRFFDNRESRAFLPASLLSIHKGQFLLSGKPQHVSRYVNQTYALVHTLNEHEEPH